MSAISNLNIYGSCVFTPTANELMPRPMSLELKRTINKTTGNSDLAGMPSNVLNLRNSGLNIIALTMTTTVDTAAFPDFQDLVLSFSDYDITSYDNSMTQVTVLTNIEVSGTVTIFKQLY